jgi:toluene monooxygenase system protein E
VLLRHIVGDNTANAEVVSGWIEKWSPPASEALEAFAAVTAEAPVPSDSSALAARITDEVSRELSVALER